MPSSPPTNRRPSGALRALQDHGLAGKIVHVGFDASEKLIEALAKSDALAGLVLQDPFAMGYLSVKTAVAHLRGEPYEKNVATAVVLATPREHERAGRPEAAPARPVHSQGLNARMKEMGAMPVRRPR